MNNANCYALENKARYIYDSDSEQQYQFLGNNIVRTQKSMSMISQKPHKAPRNAQMKKSNSFLLSTKPQTSQHKVQVESKDKSKTSTKKCLNVTEVRKKPPINSKNSMTKTSVSIGNASTKSIKSVKNKSLSRDYLIIDEQIYQCDNIEEVNEKLICGSSSMYSHERFIKATLKNQQKLEKYILSFAQFCTFRKKSRPCLPELSISQKKKLYQLLKSQTTDNSINSHKQIPRQQISIQSLIKQAYHKIEQKSIQIIRQKPEQEVSIRKWKNGKLHQLMEMHTCLKEEVEEIEQVDVRQIFRFQKNGEQIRGLMVKSEDKGLSLEFNQNNNNQMSEKNYNFSIKSHETDDKFPEHPKFKTLDNFHAPGYLPQDHNLSKAGIQSFLQSLWNYLVDSDKIGELISHILQPFGYSNSQKLQLLRNKNQVLPYKSSISQHIISNSIFISLCKANPIEQGSQDDKKSLIIFQKAVFDAFNQQITKFQTDFPFGSYHPLENNNNNAFYFIDQSNVMIVWEQCMEAVYQNNCIGLGKIKQIDETGQFGNEDKQFKQWMKQESKFYEWEIARPLARRNLLEQLIGQIEQIIFSQASTQFSNF